MEITCNRKTQTRKTLNYDMKLSTAKRPSPILHSSCSLLAHDCNVFIHVHFILNIWDLALASL